MIAIVTNSGDFDVAITFEELGNWREGFPIEGELFGEGEVPCNKRIKLILKPPAEALVNYRLDNIDWDNARIVELVCNQYLFERLNTGNGKVYTELNTPAINILIQASNALGKKYD